MIEKHLYGVNNFSGVSILGLKGSVYDIKTLYDADLQVFEEDSAINETSINLINLGKVADINSRVFNYADQLIKDSKLPICFGGDHSIAIGTISATAANYENLGVIWVDAHADINTEETSPTGNIHGMPLSFLLGHGREELAMIGEFAPKISASNIVYLGLRSVDSGEMLSISNLGIRAYYFEEIEERGLDVVLAETLDYLHDCENIHLSFDFDSMDPQVFSAVSTPVQKGFNQEEVMNIFDTLKSTNKVKAIDLVEYNRTKDQEGQSFDFALSLIKYLMD